MGDTVDGPEVVSASVEPGPGVNGGVHEAHVEHVHSPAGRPGPWETYSGAPSPSGPKKVLQDPKCSKHDV